MTCTHAWTTLQEFTKDNEYLACLECPYFKFTTKGFAKKVVQEYGETLVKLGK